MVGSLVYNATTSSYQDKRWYVYNGTHFLLSEIKNFKRSGFKGSKVNLLGYIKKKYRDRDFEFTPRDRSSSYRLSPVIIDPISWPVLNMESFDGHVKIVIRKRKQKMFLQQMTVTYFYHSLYISCLEHQDHDLWELVVHWRGRIHVVAYGSTKHA